MKANRMITATVGLAVASLALAACGGEPGAAAVIGSDRISETAFSQQVQDVLAAQQKPRDAADPAITAATMNMLVVESLVHQLADQAGIIVTPGQIESILIAQDAKLGGRANVEAYYAQQYGIAPSQINDTVRFTIELDALGKALDPTGTADTQRQAVGQAVAVLSEVLGVTVSPRYGTWDSKNVQLGPVPNDLSVPANA